MKTAEHHTAMQTRTRERVLRHRVRSLGSGLLAFAALGACSDYELTEEDVRSLAQAVTTPVTVSFQQGVSPSSSYTTSIDATLRQANPTTNYGGTTTCSVDGNDGNGVDLSCAVKWDVSSIPPGSIVQSVTMTFRVVDSSPNVYSLFPLSKEWSESQVTWNRATSSVNWATAGALGSSDRGAQIGTLTGSNGSRTATLNASAVSVVQGWVDGQLNAGIVIAHATNTNNLEIGSTEHATSSFRPRLTVTYLPPEPAGSGGSSSGGSSSGGASSGGSSSGGASSGGSSSGGATSSGGSSSGGASSGGSSSGGASGAATEQNLLVAFIGDQGDGSNATSVLNLIKNEGAAAVVHNGDFDYVDNPTSWDARINSVLGADYPYFAVIGNHDAAAWGGANGYSSFINARISRVPEMQCTGENGVKANCVFRGLHLVQSCIGTSELRSSCGKDSSEQVAFIQDSLASDNHLWSVCNWHKNQRAMQVGTKSDEVGWLSYQACMSAGAMISTGHEHSYSRTLTLTNVGNSSAGHGATGAHDLIQLGPGRTFAFVSGLGGVDIRAFSTTYHNADTWWSSYYTSDRWLRHGVLQSGTGNYGALFIRFYVDGDPKKASAYFKDVSGRVVDTFTVRLD